MNPNLENLRIIFNEVDPVGIFFDKNVDEYDAEIKELLKASPNFNDVQELQSLLEHIFTQYFEDIQINQENLLVLARKLNETFKK
jgi:hypothetical protein